MRAAFGIVFIVAVLAGRGLAGPDGVPPPVRKTVDSVLGRSAKISREGSGANLVYEATRATAVEIVVTPRGVLQETEVEIPIEALPLVVARAATARLARGAVLAEAEVVITPTGVVFEVEGKLGRKETEWRIDQTGKVLAEEHEDDDRAGDDDE